MRLIIMMHMKVCVEVSKMSRGNTFISEESLMQDFCAEFGKRMKPIMWTLGGWKTMKNPNKVWMKDWRPDHMRVFVGNPDEEKYGRYRTWIQLENLSYDSSSEKIEGKSTITRGNPRPVPNGTKTIINPYADREFPVDLSHVDKLQRRKQTSLNLSSTFTSTTEAEGTYGGVSLKQTIELSLGIQAGQESEETHEQEDTAVLPGISIPAGESLLQTVTKESVTVSTPFNLKAYPDFQKIVLDFHDNSGEGEMGKLASQRILKDNGRWGKGHYIDVEGFTGLLRLLNGGDWRFREMLPYRRMLQTQKHPICKKALKSIKWLENKNNRYIEMEGTEIDVFDDNLLIKPRFVNVI